METNNMSAAEALLITGINASELMDTNPHDWSPEQWKRVKEMADNFPSLIASIFSEDKSKGVFAHDLLNIVEKRCSKKLDTLITWGFALPMALMEMDDGDRVMDEGTVDLLSKALYSLFLISAGLRAEGIVSADEISTNTQVVALIVSQKMLSEQKNPFINKAAAKAAGF